MLLILLLRHSRRLRLQWVTSILLLERLLAEPGRLGRKGAGLVLLLRLVVAVIEASGPELLLLPSWTLSIAAQEGVGVGIHRFGRKTWASPQLAEWNLRDEAQRGTTAGAELLEMSHGIIARKGQENKVVGENKTLNGNESSLSWRFAYGIAPVLMIGWFKQRRTGQVVGP